MGLGFFLASLSARCFSWSSRRSALESCFFFGRIALLGALRLELGLASCFFGGFLGFFVVSGRRHGSLRAVRFGEGRCAAFGEPQWASLGERLCVTTVPQRFSQKWSRRVICAANESRACNEQRRRASVELCSSRRQGLGLLVSHAASTPDFFVCLGVAGPTEGLLCASSTAVRIAVGLISEAA